jgi:Pyridoxamine 5'-phosphate oxidase
LRNQRSALVVTATMAPPRSRIERIDDTRRKLGSEPDVWVAMADEDGAPYLVPRSLCWDGQHVVVGAETRSRTVQNLLRSGTARLGLGPTRDVVLIDAAVTASWPASEVPADVADAYAARAGWDPRREAPSYSYVQLEPRRIQAWREANELQGRTLVPTASGLADDHDVSVVPLVPSRSGYQMKGMSRLVWCM